MFVRLAVRSDFDAIVEMARENATTVPHLVFNEERVRHTLEGYLADASSTFWVVDHRRDILGFLQAHWKAYDAFDGHFTVQQVLYVRPDKRGTRASVLLMKQLVAWSEMLGAKEIIGGNDNEFNSERTAKFLEHFGFKRVGFAMRRVL